MEFDINIKTEQNGFITIEDYSREQGQYIQEESVLVFHGKYKYSHSKTINIITKINTKSEDTIAVLLHNHDQRVEDPTDPESYVYDLEVTSFKVNQDGYYHIHHLVIPTEEWYYDVYLQASDDYKKSFSEVYFIDSNNEFYTVINEQPQPCDLQAILDRNSFETTVYDCVIDVFYTEFLKECYIKYCKKLFATLTKTGYDNCKQDETKDLEYFRDFIWMLLNVLEYQINCKQYLEAQRVLEMVTQCGGFCKLSKSYDVHVGCGCS